MNKEFKNSIHVYYFLCDIICFFWLSRPSRQNKKWNRKKIFFFFFFSATIAFFVKLGFENWFKNLFHLLLQKVIHFPEFEKIFRFTPRLRNPKIIFHFFSNRKLNENSIISYLEDGTFKFDCNYCWSRCCCFVTLHLDLCCFGVGEKKTQNSFILQGRIRWNKWYSNVRFSLQFLEIFMHYFQTNFFFFHSCFFFSFM